MHWRMIDTMPFGSTGHQSTRVIFGAAALGGMKQERADNVVLPLLLEHGINHIDTAASYGESELRLAPWLVEHRDKFFLATKTGERVGADARAELERSLERLGVDSVDLIQLHNLVEDDEWATAHGSGGVVEAMVQARDEGLVSHIGVTGHGTRIPGMHLRSLAEFDFASVLFPYNWVLLQNDSYRADVEQLIDVCTQRGIALQTIKSIARRRWTDEPERRFSWYEPLDDESALARAVNYVLGHEGLFLNTSSDARLLEAALVAAGDLTGRPSDDAMADDATAFGIRPLFDGDALERI